ncbi:MAG: FAD binding domain-containing protein [Proteobacteria bacterium]|nr:FAD binding domain-containing protein [Pseudomonadota bacterium]
MKPAPFDYVRAGGVEEAVGLVKRHAGFAKFIAGGQSLGPMLNLRITQPDLLVDISHIEGLSSVEDSPETLSLGGGVRHADIEDGIVPDAANGMLRYVAAGISYRGVRNRGTLGGSLAHADPAADWPVAMMALDATLSVTGADGGRTIAATGLIEAPLMTVLADDELVERVKIPKLSAGARWGYHKLCRKVGEFAHSLAAAVIDRDRGYGRAVLGSATTSPFVLAATSAALLAGTMKDIEAAIERDLEASTFPFDDYERQIHRTMARRAVADARLS